MLSNFSVRMFGLRLKSKHLPMRKIFCSRLAIEITRRVYDKYLLTIHANNIRTSETEVIS